MDVTGERFTIDEFHSDERMAILLADVIDRANARMVESGCGSRLAPQSLERLRLLCQCFGEKFQGYGPVQPAIVGFVYDTHPSGAELLYDAIMRDGLTNHW